MAARLPSDFASQADYATYIKALPEAAHNHGDATENAIHDAMNNLAPRDDATKVYAVDSGPWSTAANWYPNGVPGAGAKALIGQGVAVTYDVDDDTTSLAWLRVDGDITFVTDANTALLVDTITRPSGHWTRGTKEQPVEAGVRSRIIFADSGPINLASDPMALGRGMVGHGNRVEHGAVMTTLAFSAVGAVATATSIVLDAAPTGWAADDEIVIGGTRDYGVSGNGAGRLRYFGRQDEKRTVTGVSGTTINFTPALAHDHVPYPHNHPTHVSRVQVINLTRNVTWEPENPQDIGNGSTFTGSMAYLPQMAAGDRKGLERPHVMDMHSHGVDLRYTEYKNLGRTSKFQMDDAICHGKTVGAGGNATLDGPWVTGGVASCDTLFQLVATWTTPSTITITGTNAAGGELIETSPAGVTSHTGEKVFATVTQISSSAAITNFTAGMRARSYALTDQGVKNFHESTTQVVTFDTLTAKHNIQGRYPLHIHKVSLEDYAEPAILIGNSVHETPGWGIVHHASHAIIKDNVVYDFFGAGIVGEDGNETGLWQGNCAMGARAGFYDITAKYVIDQVALDSGRSATGLWFTGRAIKFDDNYASDCMFGAVYNTRHQRALQTSASLDQPELSRGDASILNEAHPIGHFQQLTAMACYCSLLITRNNLNQNHDFRTVLDGVVSESCQVGPQITYTQHYTNQGFISIGGYQNFDREADLLLTRGFGGVLLGENATDQLLRDSYVEGFEIGVDMQHHSTQNDPDDPLSEGATPENGETGDFTTAIKNGRYLVNVDIADCTDEIGGYNAAIDEIYESEDIGTGLALELDVDRPVATAGAGFRIENRGTKTDELRTWDWPWGSERPETPSSDTSLTWGISGIKAMANQFGKWSFDGKDYTFLPEYFSSQVSGIPDLKMVPVSLEAEHYNVNPQLRDNGACDLDDTRKPVLADFTVTLKEETPATFDIIARCSHPAGAEMFVSGFTSPFNSFMTKSMEPEDEDGIIRTRLGEGAITIYPAPGYTGEEQCYIFISDKNGNTARATMTVRVRDQFATRAITCQP